MAEDNKNFTAMAPMLLGEEFAKQATTTVEQVKAIKKLTILTEKKNFPGYQLRNYQSDFGGGSKSGCERPSIQRKPDRPIIQPPRSKQPRTKEHLTQNIVNCHKEIIYCHHTLKLIKVLPSIKRNICSNKFACWSNKRISRELDFVNTKSLSIINSSQVLASSGDSACCKCQPHHRYSYLKNRKPWYQ